MIIRTCRNLTINPFVSEAQRRACYAKDDPNWDCHEWQSVTPKSLPERKSKRIKRSKQAVGNKSAEIKPPIGIIGLAAHSLVQREVDQRFGQVWKALFALFKQGVFGHLHTLNTVGNFTAAGHVLMQSPLAMPGYGQIYYNRATKQAWYVGGDGDERGFDKLVKDTLLDLPNVRSVRYESEYSPKEPGWEKVFDPQDVRRTTNAFCPTGPGGGVDASCGSSSGKPAGTWKRRLSKLNKMPTTQLAKIVAKHADREKDHEAYAKLGRKVLLSLIELHEKNTYHQREMTSGEYKAAAARNSLFSRLFGGATVAAATVGSGDNCGTGKGGFQPGNTCAKKDAGTKSGGASEGLTPREEALTHTPEFKSWFGNSKVVDHNGDPKENASIDGIRQTGTGRPIVVYHGTPTGVFHEFKTDKIANPDELHYGPGFYFTEDVKAAEEFARGGHSSAAHGATPTVMKFYLKSEKPFDADKEQIDPSKLHPEEAKVVRAGLVQKAYLDGGRDDAMDMGRKFDRGEVKMTYNELTSKAGVGGLGVSKTKIQEYLQSLGHDSITTQAPDVGEKGKNRYWIIFHPTSIKSTSNKGTFDPKDPNVLNRSFFADCERDEKGRCLPGEGERVSKATLQKVQQLARNKARNAPLPTQQEKKEAEKGLAKLGANKYRRNLVGNTHNRAKRREALLNEFGDGKTCPCVYCGIRVGEGTLEQDKIYTTSEGGRYRVANLVPSCASCNRSRGDIPWSKIKWPR